MYLEFRSAVVMIDDYCKKTCIRLKDAHKTATRAIAPVPVRDVSDFP
jgi:hypothetical protein